jgi:16S rRNA processing protein RimM
LARAKAQKSILKSSRATAKLFSVRDSKIIDPKHKSDLPTPDESDLCLIATITRPRGVQGAVNLHFHLYPEPDLRNLSELWLGQPAQCYPLQRQAGSGKQAHIFFTNVTDRNQAETLRDQSVFVQLAQLPSIRPAGQYFAQELLGLTVLTQHDETPEILGTLQEVLISKAHWIYVVATATGELLLPAIPQVVQQIDWPNRRIYVRLLPGLSQPDN